MSRLEDFKYDYPRAYRLSLVAVLIAAVGAAATTLPNSEITRAMGLVALKERCAALRSAIYWESRAAMNPVSEQAPVIDFGFVVGIDYDGQVFLSVPLKSEFVQRKVKLADIQIVDLQGVATAIQDKHQLDAKIEMYGDMAVIWIEGKPLNVELVNAGLAKPDPNPPTNIVDRIFATYFWNKAKGKNV